MRRSIKMQIKEQLKTLKPYQPGKSKEQVKEELGLDQITKLASNENPFGCSEHVKAAIQTELDQVAIYPDGYAKELRVKVSKKLNVNEKQLIFGNGSDEVVQIVSRALLGPGTNTIVAKPTFPQYRHNAVIEGADVIEVDCVDGHHNLDAMFGAINENTKIVWVCSPNNPTGTYINEATLLPFLKKVPSHVLVVVDEAYFEYVVADDYPDTVSLLREFPNLMILRTFSKAYGLASLRVGYGVANEELIQAIEPAREPFNTSRFAQAAATAALEDEKFLANCVEQNRKGLEQYYAFCEEVGLRYFPSEGNFIMIDFNESGDNIFHYLMRAGYIVRSGVALGYPTGVRITVGTEEQNNEVIQALREYLAQ